MALVETTAIDNLIASNAHPISIQTITVKSGEGKLKRGSVLMRDSNNKFVLAGASSATPPVKYGTCELILAADVDATSADTVATAYNSGEFVKEELIVASGYTLDAADEVDLKKAGIYLVSGVEAVSV